MGSGRRPRRARRAARSPRRRRRRSVRPAACGPRSPARGEQADPRSSPGGGTRISASGDQSPVPVDEPGPLGDALREVRLRSADRARRRPRRARAVHVYGACGEMPSRTRSESAGSTRVARLLEPLQCRCRPRPNTSRKTVARRPVSAAAAVGRRPTKLQSPIVVIAGSRGTRGRRRSAIAPMSSRSSSGLARDVQPDPGDKREAVAEPGVDRVLEVRVAVDEAGDDHAPVEALAVPSSSAGADRGDPPVVSRSRPRRPRSARPRPGRPSRRRRPSRALPEEGNFGSWPEASFAGREAPESLRLGGCRGGGPWGNHGFPHAGRRLSQISAASASAAARSQRRSISTESQIEASKRTSSGTTSSTSETGSTVGSRIANDEHRRRSRSAGSAAAVGRLSAPSRTSPRMKIGIWKAIPNANSVSVTNERK